MDRCPSGLWCLIRNQMCESTGGSNPSLSAISLRGNEPEHDALKHWRDDRVAEGARLEIVCTERYRGFESLSLRSQAPLQGLAPGFPAPGCASVRLGGSACVTFMVPGDATAVNPARSGRKQR